MMQKFTLIFILVLGAFSFSFGQTLESLKIKKYRTAILNDTIQETSGLTCVGPDLFTLNDSGNAGDLYRIDKKDGRILKTYKTGLRNIDWEALTTDGNSIFIGEFGNNAGTRKDLKVYRIALDNDSLKTDSITTFEFFYPEQTDFSPKNLNTNYDAEAMFYFNGSIHILTKEWASKRTTHYILDLNTLEKQGLKKLETYDTGFVVTDAYVYNDTLYTVGYTKGLEVFMMVFKTVDQLHFFTEPSQKYFIGSALSVGQVEGIAVDEKGVYISAEAFNFPLGRTKPSLYFVPHEKIE